MEALVFNNTHFNVITRNNQLWLQASEIAKALGYANANAITRIYSRNSDEFTEQMSQRVNLTLSGNLTKDVRIFSLRGAHLLAMFARTSIAKQFRQWVLDVLDHHSQGGAVNSQPIGVDGFQQLSHIVDGKVAPLPAKYQRSARQRLWNQLHRAFNVCSVQDLPAQEYDAARNFIAAYSIEGEYLAKLPNESRLSEELLRSLFLVHEHLLWVVSTYKTDIHLALHAIQYRKRNDLDQHLCIALRYTHNIRKLVREQWANMNLHPHQTDVKFIAHEITWRG